MNDLGAAGGLRYHPLLDITIRNLTILQSDFNPLTIDRSSINPPATIHQSLFYVREAPPPPQPPSPPPPGNVGVKMLAINTISRLTLIERPSGPVGPSHVFCCPLHSWTKLMAGRHLITAQKSILVSGKVKSWQ